jgi:hypothetical protein
MKYSDKLISLAIRYQAAASKYQSTTNSNYLTETEVRQAFNNLATACKYVDQFMPSNVVKFEPKGKTVI